MVESFNHSTVEIVDNDAHIPHSMNKYMSFFLFPFATIYLPDTTSARPLWKNGSEDATHVASGLTFTGMVFV